MVSSEDEATLKQTAVKWLFGQEANTIALFAILGALGYASWYMINEGIPKHLQQIHQGYKELNEQNIKDREVLRQDFRENLDRVVNIIENKKQKPQGATADGN